MGVKKKGHTNREGGEEAEGRQRQSFFVKRILFLDKAK